MGIDLRASPLARRRRIGRALAVAMTMLAIASAQTAVCAVEDGKWYRYRSANFDVYSRSNEREVAEQIHDLEAFRALVHRFLNVRESESFGHTTKLLHLPRAGHLRSLFGRKRQVVGFMRPGLRQNLLVVTNPGRRSLTSENEVAFHEYVHYLLRNASAFRYPAWYDEGFAEMLSTTQIDDDGILIGNIPRSAGYVIINDRTMPLTELISRGTTEDLSSRNIGRFYATSWLLVHYLQLSELTETDSRLRQGATDYLHSYDTGRASASVFEKAIGKPIEELEEVLDDYQRGVPNYRLPLSTVDFDGGYQREPLRPEQIAYELAYMAVFDKPRYSRKLFSRILEAEPGNARALAGLGVTHQMEADYEAAERLMRRALARDDGDYLLYIELADLLGIACRQSAGGEPCPDGAINREVEQLYRSAYQLQPENLETLAAYGTALLHSGRANEALPLLKKAHRLLPSAYGVVVSLGLAYAELDQWDEAETQLRRASGWAVDEPDEHARLRALLMQLEMARQQESDAATHHTLPSPPAGG